MLGIGLDFLPSSWRSIPPSHPRVVGPSSTDLDELVKQGVSEYKDRVRDQLFVAAEKMTLGMAHITSDALLCESAAWEVVRNIAKDTIGIGEFALPEKSISRDRLVAMQSFMDDLSDRLAQDPKAWDGAAADGKRTRRDLSVCLPLTRDRVIDRLKYSGDTQHTLDKEILNIFAHNADVVDTKKTAEERKAAAQTYEEHIRVRFVNLRRAEEGMAQQQQRDREQLAAYARNLQQSYQVALAAAQSTLFREAERNPEKMPRSYVPAAPAPMIIDEQVPAKRPADVEMKGPATAAAKRGGVGAGVATEIVRGIPSIGLEDPDEEYERLLLRAEAEQGILPRRATAVTSNVATAAVAAAAKAAGVVPSDLSPSIAAAMYTAISKANAEQEKRLEQQRKDTEKKQKEEKNKEEKRLEQQRKETEKKAETLRKEVRQDTREAMKAVQRQQEREEKETKRQQDRENKKAEILAREEQRRKEKQANSAKRDAERKALEEKRQQERKKREEQKEAKDKEKQEYKAGVDDPYFKMLTMYDTKLALLQRWVNTDDWPAFDDTRDFIQILFPTKRPSSRYNTWLALTELQVREIRNNLEIQLKMLQAFRYMLNFYGLEINFDDQKAESPGILVGNSEDEKDRFYKYFVRGGEEQNNWYRIDRIIKSLNVVTEGGFRVGQLSQAFDYLKEFLEDRNGLVEYIPVYPQWIASANEAADLVY